MQTTANRGRAREAHPGLSIQGSTPALGRYYWHIKRVFFFEGGRRGGRGAGDQSSHTGMEHLDDRLQPISLQCSPSHHHHPQTDKAWPSNKDEQKHVFIIIHTVSKKTSRHGPQHQVSKDRISKGLEVISQELVKGQSWRPCDVQSLINSGLMS